MNRDIKFRVWDKKDKRFIKSPTLFYQRQNGLIFDGHEIRGFNDYIIQQFTGLKDKSGKEIYDGDIIKYVLGDNIFNVIVQWGDCSWIVWDIAYKCHIGHLTIAKKDYEVIGNIFENPELCQT